MDAHATETVDEIRRLTNAALGRADVGPITPKPDRVAIENELRNAAEHELVDTIPGGGGGLSGRVKTLVMRLSAFSWSRQRSVNYSLRQTIVRLLDEIDDLRSSIDVAEQRAALRATVTAAELKRLGDQLGTNAHDPAPSVRANAHDDVWCLAPNVVANDGDSELDAMYGRLEAAFRSADSVLQERLGGYLGDLEFLRGGNLPLLDIGCGRGDFLAVLRNAGIAGRGIDQNAAAVAEATANGLDVTQGDALEYLATVASGSLGAVVALHVVEHLQPETCLALVDEARRVLAPGGLLILETPNPTNLAVGAASFYLDPTHVRPVPADYLQFLVRDRGFDDVEVRFLHALPEYEATIELPEQPNGRAFAALVDDLKWALKGPLDYAVLARCPGR